MQELSVRIRVEHEGQRTRRGHVQGPEVLHLGVRPVTINGHRDERLVEAGLDRLLGNGALDQGAARASSSPAELNEYLLALNLRGSESFGKRRVPLERATIVEMRMGSRGGRHDVFFSPFTCNTSLASRNGGTGSGCESTPSRRHMSGTGLRDR